MAEGILIGFINGMFGSGGGIAAVTALKNEGLDQKTAQQNAIAVIFPITVISAVSYIALGRVSPSDAFIFIPSGLVGVIIAYFVMKKSSPKFLRILFGAFAVFSGVRMLLK